MNATFSYYTKSNLKKKTNKNNLIKRKIKICTGDVPVDGRRGAPSPPTNQTIDVLIGNREKQKKEEGGEGMENGRVTRSLSSHVLYTTK